MNKQMDVRITARWANSKPAVAFHDPRNKRNGRTPQPPECDPYHWLGRGTGGGATRTSHGRHAGLLSGPSSHLQPQAQGPCRSREATGRPSHHRAVWTHRVKSNKCSFKRKAELTIRENPWGPRGEEKPEQGGEAVGWETLPGPPSQRKGTRRG